MNNLIPAKSIGVIPILLLMSFALVSCALTHHATESSKSTDKNIKTRTTTSYLFKEVEGEYIRELNYKWVSKFDREGNSTESLRYDSSNKLIMKTVDIYDDGNSKFETTFYGDEEETTSKSICSFNDNDEYICLGYDTSGKLIKKDASNTSPCEDEDGKSFKTRHDNQYDSYGNLSMITTYGIDGGKEFPKHRLIFEYVYYQ